MVRKSFCNFLQVALLISFVSYKNNNGGVKRMLRFKADFKIY